jgi:formate/nitrite transporter FocA (FNT family)
MKMLKNPSRLTRAVVFAFAAGLLIGVAFMILVAVRDAAAQGATAHELPRGEQR